MERYDSYKDSGIPWVSQIPTQWKVERAKWLFNRAERPVRPDDEVITAFRDGQVTLRTNRRVEGFTNAIQESGYQGIRKGDLVISAMDAFAGAIGVSDSDGKSTPVYAACMPTGEYPVNNYFYAYLIRHMAYSGYIASLSKGIRERSTDFRFAEFRELPLPIPELAEQERIVAFLDQKTAEIDTAIAKKERLIELLQEQKSILINQAVTRGLNPDVPLRDSGVDWIGQIPTHWDVRKVAHLFRLIGSGTTPPSGDLRYYEDGSIDWVNTGDLTDWDIVAETKKLTPLAIRRYSTLKIYPKGTLIVAMYGATIGKTGISTTPAAVNQACCCLNGSDAITSRYAQLWFFGYKRAIVSMGYGGGQPNISQEVIRSLRIPVPPIDEQTEIVSHIEAAMTKIDRVAEMTIATLSQLNEIKSSLIASAVTGKIKV